MSWIMWFAIISTIFFVGVKIAEKVVIKKKKNNDNIENVEIKKDNTEIKEG